MYTIQIPMIPRGTVVRTDFTDLALGPDLGTGVSFGFFLFFYIFSSFHELIQSRGVRRLSVRPSVRPSYCKLLRKSLLLAGKWPDRHQTSTRWSPGQRASRVCSRSRSRSKVT